MTDLPICTRSATTFAEDLSLDEDALASHLQRLVDAGVGLWLGSGGSGEGFTLSFDELTRVYRVGVAVGKGRVLVGSNQPETHTPAMALEHARCAIAAGVETVNLYGPSSWHGFRPTDAEFLQYMDRVIGELSHELALSPNGTLGYAPKASLIAAVCNKYPQVTTVNLTGIVGDTYLLNLKDALDRDITIYHGYLGSANALALGATGLHDSVAEANILPKTFREYASLCSAGKLDQAATPYAHLKRFADFVGPWRSASPRWIKMAMKVLCLPGGGTLREPYLLPDATEQQRFLDGLLSLGIPELDDLAKGASV